MERLHSRQRMGFNVCKQVNSQLLLLGINKQMKTADVMAGVMN